MKDRTQQWRDTIRAIARQFGLPEFSDEIIGLPPTDWQPIELQPYGSLEKAVEAEIEFKSHFGNHNRDFWN